MQKPSNYDSVQVAGDFIPVELGGHYGVIKNVSERTTKNGDPMIVVSIDFDAKDSQPGYFTEMFKKDVRPDKKYPNQATNYITTEWNGECTSGFKKFIKAYADSNGLKDADIKWGEDFAAQFKNKKIGVVFGNEEQLYNGEVKKCRVIRWFCNYNNVPKQNVPNDKLLPGEGSKATGSEDFMKMPSADMEQIPFD